MSPKELISAIIPHEAKLFQGERWIVENTSYRIQQRELIKPEEIEALTLIHARLIERN